MLLSMSAFSANFGSVALLMSLSLKAFAQTGSSLLAGAIYGSQWLIPLFFLPMIGWLANRYPLRRLMSVTLVLSVAVTVVVCQCYPHYLLPFFGLMAVRGVLENVSKSAAAVALKVYMPGRLLERASSFYDTNRYVSSATASLVGVLFLNRISIAQVALLSSSAFVIAACCYAALPYVPAVKPDQPRPDFSYWRETWRILERKPLLRRCFVNLSLITGVFQGFYYIARSTLPIGQLGLSINAAAFVQALISLTFTAGAMFVARFMPVGAPPLRWLSPLVQTVAAAFFMAGSVLTRQPVFGIASFLACLFFYEVYYTFTNNQIMLTCTPEEISYISSAKYGALTFCMLVVIVAGGAAADAIGFASMTLVLAWSVVIGFYIFNNRLLPESSEVV
ncbi:MFS transporter [Paraburkholderia sp. G-4-1-8]|uniref:MFS transporter n=1 Tax=Paraburkholderia antibiotica TaxID=2728839 RepID=A0A7X9X5E6_9BURK|nr:MFS transporter [Paraburkholderia antibiotica]